MAFLGGGFFGSGAKETNTSSETTTSSNVLDFTDSNDSQANISTIGKVEASDGSGVTITTTDFGALDTARDISGDAFEFATTTSENQAQATGAAIAGVREVAEDAVKVAESAARDESARTIQFVVVGAIIVGISFALRKTIAKALK